MLISRVQIVAVQIVNEVDDVCHAGSMVALIEYGLQRFNLVAVQLGNEVRQMVQLVQVFILGEIVCLLYTSDAADD